MEVITVEAMVKVAVRTGIITTLNCHREGPAKGRSRYLPKYSIKSPTLQRCGFCH